jgi:hypothetical protein
MKRVCFRKTPEQIQWVKDNCNGLTYAGLTKLFNEHWKTELTEMQVKSICFNYKIKTGARGKSPKIVKPNGQLSRDEKRIKINGEWHPLFSYLHIRELRKALKERLKKEDKKLYNRSFGGGASKYYLKKDQLLVKLTEKQ